MTLISEMLRIIEVVSEVVLAQSWSPTAGCRICPLSPILVSPIQLKVPILAPPKNRMELHPLLFGKCIQIYDYFLISHT